MAAKIIAVAIVVGALVALGWMAWNADWHNDNEWFN